MLNTLGNNLKYSMICTNWYEITHSATALVCCICSVSGPILCDSLEIQKENCHMDRPPLSLRHRYKEVMDLFQPIICASFHISSKYIIPEQFVHIIRKYTKAADSPVHKGGYFKYYDMI